MFRGCLYPLLKAKSGRMEAAAASERAELTGAASVSDFRRHIVQDALGFSGVFLEFFDCIHLIICLPDHA